MTSIAWAENFFKQSDIRIRTPGSPPADASAVPEANERGAGWAHPQLFPTHHGKCGAADVAHSYGVGQQL